ncbi:Rieske (2Fe-2S) protein [Granulibacter bethesdensis]|uniref:Rieske (2Fe-2S) protein n=1 Tax=Granulibacter bethesdensis TaxID=364410 RepID=UPI000909CA37|nr:Rieske 2Fe-2S domain-containing protein [Granulibacter bethesdensis]APH58569.1 Rieske (2Fe-2S) domain protein [Granulibacter bethesdensis]
MTVSCALRFLCHVQDLSDPGAKGFPPAPGGFFGLFAIRRGDDVRVYVNACPHIGVPLEWAPDRFLSSDGQHIVCGTHGALFDLLSGACQAGPCKGDHLTMVPVTIENGAVYVAADAGL